MNTRKRRLARIDLSVEMLTAMLHMPEGVSVERIAVSDWYGEAFLIVVSHPSFPQVDDGGVIPGIDVTASVVDGRFVLDWALPNEEEEG